METTGRLALCICTALFMLVADTSCEFIRILSPVEQRGVEGKSLLLAVETRFRLSEAEIQGSWSHAGRPSGARTVLVTFTKAATIVNMMYHNHVVFTQPDISLGIQSLTRQDEGDYHLDLNIKFLNRTGPVIKVEKTVSVTVDVPVSTPVIKKSPSHTVVEDKGNVTWTCSVERGTRVGFQWLRNDTLVGPSDRHRLSQDNSTLVISPVRKEDIGEYRCVASNPVSQNHSSTSALNVYYGPYNLEVNSGQGLRTGAVFTINPGELVFFDCQADSNPPNTYVWISMSRNASQVITEGPRLEVLSYRLAQPEDYLCRAFNNVTQKQDEAQFTLLVARTGPGKNIQDSNPVSPLAAITVCSLFIIACMLLVFLRRTCHPKRVIMSIYNRPLAEQKRPHRSGHEDATEDFGIYEFVSIPGKMESTQASCRSLARLETVQDLHMTIYDVIRHVPETTTQSLLK